SPTDYQIVHRINKAKKLIRSEENITQVALECGFFDHSHFTHYFNKFLGITPSQYKKNIIQLSA
ncbi:MAG: helix-turn-helix transcriptional regulator, partial [Thermoflexibacteraceae bacterium]